MAQRFGKKFGQRTPPLSKLLKDILERYPEGGQILKELVQNADDAGATEVQFLLDARPNAYGRDTLINEEMKQFQGPALYAQNNAVFQEKDWEGIQKPYQSVKEEDPMKVGRFGIGFNSVYHLTDLPSVVSGNTVGFFDPHEKYVAEGESGRSYLLSDASTFPDQFSPYNVLGCRVSDGDFMGTLFRFPLRTNGSTSELSKSTPSPASIHSLFESFETDAHLVPLFLKSVSSIKILEWNLGKAAPEELFSVALGSDTKECVEDARKRLEAGIRDNRALVQEAFTASVVCCNRGDQPVTQRWLVVHYISKQHAKVAQMATELKQLPWVGLALPLEPFTKQAVGLGRIFCFLPLPPSDDDDSNTGLPIHVHGSFSVADNRRSLKWPGADRQADEKALWNHLLLEHLIVPAYSWLIRRAISLSLDHASVYRAWPRPRDVKNHWKTKVLPGLLSDLKNYAILWTKAHGGKWIEISDSVLNDSSTLGEHRRVAFEEMIVIGKNVALAPENVLECLEYVSTNYRAFDCAFIRSALKENCHYQMLSRREKLSLLHCVLEDNSYSELDGICLLPVSNFTFVAFQLRRRYVPGEEVYIADDEFPFSLFPGIENKFLDASVEKPLFKKLTSRPSCTSLRLKHLEVHSVSKLLKSVFDETWTAIRRDVRTVHWNPAQRGHPTREWMQQLWQWLAWHGSVLSDLTGYTIVPHSRCTRLAQLIRQENVIFAQHDSFSVQLPPSVSAALDNTGCVVLQDCPEYVSSNGELTKYIWSPLNVLACLAKVSVPVVQQSSLSWSPQQCEEMLSFLYKIVGTNPPRDDDQRIPLLYLPLFRRYQTNAYVCLVNCNNIAPRSLMKGLPIRRDLLTFPNHEESAILKHMSHFVHYLSFSNIFLKFVFPDFPKYSRDDRTTIVKYLLDNTHQIDHTVRQTMATLEFVPVSDGSLRKPSELFLPSGILLRLFSGQPVFPIGLFDPCLEYGRKLFTTLASRQLESITASELFEIAKCASRGDFDKGEALFCLFSDNLWARQKLTNAAWKQSFMTTYVDRFRDVEWCPVESEPVEICSVLPWKASSEKTAYTEDIVCTLSDMDVSLSDLSCLVGSSAFIVKGGVVRDKSLMQFLGLQLPTISDVISQWEEAIKRYSTHPSPDKFDGIMKSFFKTLSQLTDSCWTSSSLRSEISRRFENSSFVWLNETHGFVRADRIAQSCRFRSSLEPWLFKIDQYPHLKKPNLLKTLGIQEEFTQADVLRVLDEMKTAHENGESKANFYRDLDLAIQILNWVTEEVEVLPEHLKQKVLVPADDQRVLDLQSCDNVMYCDAEWLRSSDKSSLTDEFKVIHRKITHDTAYKLGIHSLSKRLAPSESLDFGFEQLGPNEPLTLRINNILSEYKDDAGIFKELVQNADDAGATEVSILVDWRQGGSSSVLSPDMKHCQGPALWAYNNATFRDEDFVNIAKLAGKTKMKDLNKIGRFGLGFTSVYHLTDVPSFVSRNFVVIFDPHRCHLGNHITDPSKPGVKIDFCATPIAERFPDQFQPYEGVFGCNVKDQKAFPGTLFRLPLRTRYQAFKSEIKNEAYDEHHVQNALDALKQVGEKIMLFLNNVRSVNVYELKKGSTSPMSDRVFLFGMTASDETPELLTSSMRQSQMFHLASEVVRSGTSVFQANGSTVRSVEFRDARCVRTDRWLICSSIGRNQSRVLARSPEGRKSGLMPFAGVAAKLSSGKPAEPVAVNGEVFCFLPLSIATGLPFHVNGFFAVHSNRRSLWWHNTESVAEDRRDIDARWNEALITDALSEATLAMLMAVTSVSQNPPLGDYYRLWPDVSSAQLMWSHLAESFYSAVINEKPALFKTTSEWIALPKALILPSDVKSIPHAESLTERSCPNYVPIPDSAGHVLLGLTSVDEAFLRERLMTVESFAEKVLPNALTLLEATKRDELICAVLKLIISPSQHLCGILKEMSFVPCSPDGTNFSRPCFLIQPDYATMNLFSEEDGRFPFQSYRTPDILQALTVLGMKTYDLLDWDDVTERLLQVCCISEDSQIKTRFDAVTKLMENLDSSGKPCSHTKKAEIQSIECLPVMTCPEDYPLSSDWFSDVHHINRFVASSAQVFYKEFSREVGTQGIVLKLLRSDLRLYCSSVFEVEPPPLALVLAQLDTALNRITAEETVSESLQDLIYAVYVELNNRFIVGDLTEEIVSHSSFLSGRTEWILVGNSLVEPSQLAFEFSSDKSAPKYLHPVPYQLQGVRELLEAAGVRQRFEKEDYVRALKRMAEDKVQEKLTDEEVAIATSFIQKLSYKEDKEWRESQRDEQEVLLISENLLLLPASQLTYVDASWARPSGAALEDRIFVSSHLTSGDVLLEFGVIPARSRMVDSLSQEFPGDPFGQYEPLTTRIKNIITAYPWGVQILQELLQNADDAQASTLHIIFDKRVHGKEFLMSDKWKDLQGPALLVYNDRPFTENDIRGIQNLGQGSKRDDSSKTGQYGIGFNSVYHITDCPSFISNDDLFCVLDPHRRFVPGATVDKPGRLFKPPLKKVWENFKDMKPCYYSVLDRDVSLKGGTLFRFPLRTEKSEISNEVTAEAIEELLDDFAANSGDLLLFLNFVTSLKLSIIDENGAKQDTFSVRADVDASAKAKRKEFSQKIVQLKDVETNRIPSYHATYKVSVSSKSDVSGNDKKRTWLVHQFMGKADTEENFSDVRRLSLFPRGGIAAIIDEKIKDGRAYCYLPLPENIPLPVYVNGHFALDSARRNLFQDTAASSQEQIWNDKLIDLTIAPAYARFIEEAREYVMRGDKNPSRETLVKRLSWFHSLFPSWREEETYWGRLSRGVYSKLVYRNSPVLALVNRPLSFPRHLTRQEKPSTMLFTKMKERLSFKPSLVWLSAGFVASEDGVQAPMSWNPSILDGFDTRDKCSEYSFVLKSLLLFLGLPIVATSWTICEALNKVPNCGLQATSQVSVYNFLIEFTEQKSCKLVLGQVEETVFEIPENVDFLLQFLFKTYGSTEEPLSMETLNNLPLLLTADGALKQFSEEDYVYSSRFSQLLPQNQNLFLHSALRRSSFRFYKFQSPAVKELSPCELLQCVQRLKIFELETLGKYNEKTDLLRPDDSWLKWFWEYIYVVAQSSSEFEKAIGLFQELPVIPVTTGTRSFRAPAKLGHTICHTSGGDPPVELVLRAIGVPFLQFDILFGKEFASYAQRTAITSFLVESKLATTSKPERLITALVYLFEESVDLRNKESLDSGAAQEILRYFNNLISVSGKASCCLERIKSLPLFENVAGKFIRISLTTALTLPDRLPEFGSEKWMKAASDTTANGIVFLKRKPDLNSLYNFFKLDDKSIDDIYVEHILEHFFALTQEDRMSHLEYLANRFLAEARSPSSYNGTNSVIEKLKTTPCLQRQSKLCCVSTFFDRSVLLFKRMLRDEQFPPQTNSFDWILFLRLLGLQTVASEEKLIDFATKLENEGKRSMDTEDAVRWAEKSRLLFCHLFSYYQNRAKETWCKLGSICCLPAKEVRKELTIFSQQCHSKTSCRATSFKNCVIFTASNERLCWTSRSFSPIWDELLSLDPIHLEWLGLAETPSFSDVLSNISTYVGAAMAGVLKPEEEPDSQNVAEMTRITLSVLDYLHKFSGAIDNLPKLTSATDLRNPELFIAKCSDVESEEAVKCLHSLPFVFIPHHVEFASPIQIALKLEKDISPHLFTLPADYASYSNVLRFLGTDTEARPFHYARTLESIFCHSKESGLTPNDTENALLATAKLFLCLKEDREVSVDSLRPLYLLTREDELKLSSELVFLDNVRHENVIGSLPYHFLVDLQKCKLSSLHEETVDLLPKEIRPRMLSSLVGERIKEESIVKSSNEQRIEEAGGLEDFLKSEMLAKGIKSVYVHQYRTESLPPTLLKGLQTLAEKFEVECLHSFCTSLVVFSSQEEIGEPSQRDIFLKSTVNEEDPGPTVLYITDSFLNSATKPGSTFSERVADCVLRVLQTSFKQDSVIVGMLSLEVYEGIPVYLKDRNIEFLELCEEENFSESRGLGRVVCGKRLFSSHERQIKYDFNFKFEVDEWVAYEKDEDSYIYAKIFHKVYERSVKAKAGSVRQRPKYMIIIGLGEPIEADSMKLFKFFRDRPAPNLPELTEERETAEESTDVAVLTEEESADHLKREALSLEGKKDEVRTLLSEIWALENKDDQRRAIKRLFLQWHPDKNDEPDAKDVFIFLKAEVEKGPPAKSRSETTGGNTSFSYTSFYDEWNSYAKRSRRRPREQEASPQPQSTSGQFRSQSRRRRSGPAFFSRSCPPPTPHLKPDPRWGAMFIRQAKADSLAAQEHYERQRKKDDTVSKNFALVCYQCRESVEKALKGILLCKKGVDSKRMEESKLQAFLHASDYVGRHSEELVDYVLLINDEDASKARMPSADSTSEPASLYVKAQADIALEGAEGVQKIVSEMFSSIL
ncbi:sacsin-like isoform X2 [Oscarella lobularis]